MSTERVLVQGADSPLGRRVIEMLSAAPETDVMRADALDRSALEATLRRTDVVINATMGSAREIRAAAARLYRTPVYGARPQRVVHVSSMAVYGEATGCCDEATPAAGTRTRYGAIQLAAEAEARRFAPAVILRPGCEYGPGCEPWSGRIARWLVSRRIGDLGAGGDGFCNLIFIDDLARAVRAAMCAPNTALDRMFNIAMRDPPTWNEYLIAFAIALGATPVRRMSSRRLVVETRLLASPLKLAGIALDRLTRGHGHLPPAIPPSFRRLCAREIRLDVTAAESVLHLKWTPLELGLRAVARARETMVRRDASSTEPHDSRASPVRSPISSRQAH